MHLLNLGILAHVDAGKTSLTERLLYAAGVIGEIGSVDDGSTQTDSLATERRRGITIKSAVVSFAIGDVTVNLIDTPGHPDFIAEVERVLAVLDGAILVISAVESVQAQTRVLMRALQRLAIPTVIFVNKIDRPGADGDRVMADISAKLTPAAVAMGSVDRPGTRAAQFAPYHDGAPGLTELLAEHDDAILAAYVSGAAVPSGRLRRALAAQTRRALVHPVFFGSAITGAGTGALSAGIARLLPAAAGDASGPVCGTVFKVDRGPAGEKVAYARLFSGTVRTRDRLPCQGQPRKVTAISVFDGGSAVPAASVSAGQIGKLWGLAGIQIGDSIGVPRPGAGQHHFAPPTLETVVAPCRPADKGALRAALAWLAEQDPLINLRQDDIRQELSVSLYGEVQKEVISETLAIQFAVQASFRESTTICIERLSGAGAAAEIIAKGDNPFLATVGLRAEPGPVGGGVTFLLEVELGSLPFSFMRAVQDTVAQALQQGLYGWQVPDAVVTMTHSGYWPRQSHMHGTFDASMSSTAGDFHHLTALVLMDALRRAGTVVHEPVHRFGLELPADTLAVVLPALARLGAVPLGAVPLAPELRGGSYLLAGGIPAARVHELRQQLPALTRGEGVLDSAFDHYQPVRGPFPSRPRTGHNPLNRKQYLLAASRRVTGR